MNQPKKIEPLRKSRRTLLNFFVQFYFLCSLLEENREKLAAER